MKAIVFDKPGDENVLQLGSADAPICGDDDIRVHVRATAVNRADLLQRQGFYPPPPGASPLLGLECGGEVVEVGERVRGWATGDRAMALLSGGGYAEEAVVHGGSAMHVPAALSDIEAGAMPEVFLTAFLNIFQLGAPPPGAFVLIHGGGSGVGTAAISLCKEAGLRSVVTAGSPEKCQRCLEHGAELAINYREGEFAPAVQKFTDGKGVRVILDCIGGRYLAGNLGCLAVDGRLVIIGLMGGGKAEIDLASLLMKRIHVIGSTLRSRPPSEKAHLVSAFVERFGPAMEAGRLRPVIDRVLPLAEAAEAHRVMKASTHFGKIVLQVS